MQESKKEIVFMVSEKCGHTMCYPCFNEIYKKEVSTDFKHKCFLAKCEIQMHKKDYQKYEPIERLVLKDNERRKLIKRIYNKTRKDFASEDDYNDYLEEIEDKIFALNDPETSKEEKQKISQKINADRQKMDQQNEIANQNAKNEE